MAATCQDVQQLLAQAGKAGLADRPDLQDHIGGCERCADMLIHIEEPRGAEAAPAFESGNTGLIDNEPTVVAPPSPPAAAAAVATPPSPADHTTTVPPPLPPSPAPPAAKETDDAASPPPPRPLVASPSAPAAAAGALPPIPVVTPSAAAPEWAGTSGPALGTSVAGATLPPLPQPGMAEPPKANEWLPTFTPSGLPSPGLPPAAAFPPSDPWGQVQRRVSMRIKPIHFWLGSVGSALVSAVVVLTAVVVVSRHSGWFGPPAPPPPQVGDAGLVAPPLVQPPPEEPELQERPSFVGGQARPKARGKALPGKGPEPPAGKPGGRELTQSDVLGSIKQNVPKLGPCLEAARRTNDLTAGKHSLIFSFTVLPNGTVKDGKLDGPAYLFKTATPACFAAKMSTWKFPPSGAGATVRNFVLPVNLK